MGLSDDRERQRVLYEKYAPIILRRCLKFFSDEQDAEDATSEVFMRLMENWDGIADQDNAAHWIHRVATNYCIGVWRLRKSRATDADDKIEDHPAHAEDDLEHRIMVQDMVRKIMFPWNAVVREILVYTYWDGYSQDEIASITGIAPSTIRKYLTRFRKKAGKMLMEKTEGPHGR